MTKPWSVRTWPRNIAWCHLQQMPVKQMPIIPIIVSHLHCICIPHTHAYVYIYINTHYIYTHYTYTHYINICIHTYIYLTHTYIYTIYTPPIYPRIPMFAIAPLFWLKILKWWIISPQQTTPAETVVEYDWLVVDLPPWKMMEFVSWDDDIPKIWKNVPNHQPNDYTFELFFHRSPAKRREYCWDAFLHHVPVFYWIPAFDACDMPSFGCSKLQVSNSFMRSGLAGLVSISIRQLVPQFVGYIWVCLEIGYPHWC